MNIVTIDVIVGNGKKCDKCSSYFTQIGYLALKLVVILVKINESNPAFCFLITLIKVSQSGNDSNFNTEIRLETSYILNEAFNVE